MILTIQGGVVPIMALVVGAFMAVRRYYSLLVENFRIQKNTKNQLAQAKAELERANANLEVLAARAKNLLQTNQQLEREIIERKQAQKATANTHNLLNSIVENLPLGIFIKEVNELRFVFWNKANEELTGYSQEEVLGKNDYGIFPPEQADFFTSRDREVLASGKLLEILEEPIQTKHQGLRILHTKKIPIFDEAGTPQYLLGISEDITERKQALEALGESEAAQSSAIASLQQQAVQMKKAMQTLQSSQSQLVQNEKMSSLGQLVAGVAHEINNPVSFIYGNLAYADQYTQNLLHLLQLYQRYYPDPVPEIEAYKENIDLTFVIEDLSKILSSMKLGADRIRQIVLSLRNFSRLDQAEMKAVDIHEGLDSTLLILQHRMKAKGGNQGIELIKEYGNLPLVECHAGQMNQVFMNILNNAIDILEEYSYQHLAIATIENLHTHSLQLGQTPPISNTQVPVASIRIRTEVVEIDDCPQVVIRIRDNGSGIPPEAITRLFDPFFTTKPVGKGTGLGLSISHQIVVEKHGGVLTCSSEPGQGTEFYIEIPIVHRRARTCQEAET
ncbi:ATP-binding protein [Trichocoleus sp. ST-U3]|uniref:ATP-binding protein n=1 Tax=Coleofasciculus sp. FACHB-542 TaxID=2692787 RepID=UPI001688440E|nr:ATP-binding protein [Coleofasciculus sp. FACHB-542]MBD2087330.1 PAS domain-containing protein [Coleofasciculus sp. FACHB-542]